MGTRSTITRQAGIDLLDGVSPNRLVYGNIRERGGSYAFTPASDSPLSADGILRDQRVGREEHAVVLDGLADEHPVERIAMQNGQFVQMNHRLLIERQRRNPMPFTLLYDESVQRTRQRQFSEGVLDGQFPYRDGAEKDFVARIGE